MDTHFGILSNQSQPNQHILALMFFLLEGSVGYGTQVEKSVLKLRRLEPTAGHTSGTEGR